MFSLSNLFCHEQILKNKHDLQGGSKAINSTKIYSSSWWSANLSY